MSNSKLKRRIGDLKRRIVGAIVFGILGAIAGVIDGK